MWKSFVSEPHGEWSELAAGYDHFAIPESFVPPMNAMECRQLIVSWLSAHNLIDAARNRPVRELDVSLANQKLHLFINF